MKLTIKLILALLLNTVMACQKTPEVSVARVTRAPIEASVNSVNAGMVRSEQIAELAFGAVGRVKNISVKLGDQVKKDFLIAEVENDDALATLQASKRELDRQLRLQEKGLSSPSQVDQARNARDIAQTAYEKTRILAPFDGVIAELNLEVGQLSQITTEFKRALIRLVDLQPRYVRAEIDEVDMPRVKVGQKSRVKVLAIRKEPFDAVVRKVVPFVNAAREQDRTSEIELNVASEELLPVGASAEVEIIVEEKASVLNVPLRCILSRAGKRYVFKIENGKAVEAEVELGLSNYDSAEIITGLAEGDLVIIPDDSVELSNNLSVRPKE